MSPCPWVAVLRSVRVLSPAGGPVLSVFAGLAGRDGRHYCGCEEDEASQGQGEWGEGAGHVDAGKEGCCLGRVGIDGCDAGCQQGESGGQTGLLR